MSTPNAVGGADGVGAVAPLDIQVPDILAVNDEMQNALLKNIALHDALAQSIQVAPSQRNAAASGYNLQAQQNADNLGLEPSMVQARKAALDREIQLIPLQTQADVGNLSTQIALQPGERQLGLNTQDIQAAGQRAAYPQANLLATEAQQDPTGGLTNLRNTFQSIYGFAPQKDDGSLDYDAMKNFSTQLAQLKMRQLALQNPALQKLAEVAISKNRPDLALQLSGYGLGNGQSLNDVVSAIQNSPAQLNPQQSQDAAQDAGTLVQGLKRLNDLRALVNTPGVVGPQAMNGAWPGRSLAQAQAFFGGDSTKLANQNEVNQQTSGELGKVIESLKGIRSANIADKVGGQIPSLNGTTKEWNDYLDRNISAAQSALDTIKSQLPQGIKIPEAPAPTPAPTANSKATVDLTKYTLVTSQAQYDALPKGTLVRDAAGNYGPKP